MAPGEKYALTVTSTTYEPTYDELYLSKVDYDLWLGPAAKTPFNVNHFHYNWHWHFAYGNGDTMAADLEYVALPQGLKALVRKQWATIKGADGKALASAN